MISAPVKMLNAPCFSFNVIEFVKRGVKYKNNKWLVLGLFNNFNKYIVHFWDNLVKRNKVYTIN